MGVFLCERYLNCDSCWPQARVAKASSGVFHSGAFAGRVGKTVTDHFHIMFGHLRTDLERKVLRGEDAQSRLVPDAYTTNAHAAVYERLSKRACGLLDVMFPDETTGNWHQRRGLRMTRLIWQSRLCI